jgi:hypothetical protein
VPFVQSTSARNRWDRSAQHCGEYAIPCHSQADPLDETAEHLPESSVEILGHSVGGITYRRHAHRAPLAFKAIIPLPQLTAFLALIHGHDRKRTRCACRPTAAQPTGAH